MIKMNRTDLQIHITHRGYHTSIRIKGISQKGLLCHTMGYRAFSESCVTSFWELQDGIWHLTF